MVNQQITQMDLDFTGVESFSYIPVGTHTVKVKDAEFTKAQTGSSQLAINFEDANGATRRMWCSCVPAALWKVKQVLEALGLIGLDGRILLNTKNLIGRTCQITVEDDPNDSSRQIVSRVSKLGSLTPAPETPSMTPSSPSEPVQTPVEQPNPAPSGNIPPWMQNAQAQAVNTPQGNLPPWVRQPQ